MPNYKTSDKKQLQEIEDKKAELKILQQNLPTITDPIEIADYKKRIQAIKIRLFQLGGGF